MSRLYFGGAGAFAREEVGLTLGVLICVLFTAGAALAFGAILLLAGGGVGDDLTDALADCGSDAVLELSDSTGACVDSKVVAVATGRFSAEVEVLGTDGDAEGGELSKRCDRCKVDVGVLKGEEELKPGKFSPMARPSWTFFVVFISLGLRPLASPWACRFEGIL